MTSSPLFSYLAEAHRRYSPFVRKNLNCSPQGRRLKSESQPLPADAKLHWKIVLIDPGLALRWALPYGVLAFKI